MNLIAKIEKLTLAYGILGVSIFAYILLRALKLDITYDEARTIKDFVPLNYINIINCSSSDANNHILNTLLIKIFYSFGSNTIFFARLPNVLAFILYLFYSYKIAKEFLSDFAGFMLFALLLINPFLLDFYSIARGYGLGLSFQIMSIYYFILLVRNKQLKLVVLTLVSGAFAVLSNLSELNYWVPLLFSVVLAYVLNNNSRNKPTFWLFLFLITSLFALIIYEPIRKLHQNGDLYYGGNSNFYADTLISLTKYTRYTPETSSITYVILNTFIMLFVTRVCVLLIISIKNNVSFTAGNSLIVLLTLAVLSTISQHYLFGTLYLIDRTALFYYPLIMLVLCYSYDLMLESLNKVVPMLILALFGYNFLTNANMYKTALWYFDSHTTSILHQINETGQLENRKITIDFSWPFQKAMYFYTEQGLYPFITIVKSKTDREEINEKADYFIYLGKSLEKVGYDSDKQHIINYKKDTAFYFKNEAVYVFSDIR